MNDIADKLRKLADQIEEENSAEWDSPWDWPFQHTAVVYDQNPPKYKFGIDVCGRLVIHNNQTSVGIRLMRLVDELEDTAEEKGVELR